MWAPPWMPEKTVKIAEATMNDLVTGALLKPEGPPFIFPAAVGGVR